MHQEGSPASGTKSVLILGSTDPAIRGGFKTFAKSFKHDLLSAGGRSGFIAKNGVGSSSNKISGQGVNWYSLRIRREGVLSTMLFDGIAAVHSMRFGGPVLVLGYDLPALFNIVKSPSRAERVLFNMDGVEWERAKWGYAAKCWFRLNNLWQRRSPTA